MFSFLLYVISLGALFLSWKNDRVKTKKAVIESWKSFENILPQFLGVLAFIGISLAYLDTELISRILGNQSGVQGVVIAAFIGAVTLIPGFVAFPTTALLIKNGAGLMQMGAFVSTLMMVGIVTMPVEIRYFGKKITIYRNALAFIFSFIVAWVIGVAVKI